MNKAPLAIDLFAGAGGLSLGFEAAGFKLAAAVEYDPVHCATHHFNFPECFSICRSVSDISGSEIRERAGIGNKDIAVVIGGPPCQGFSLIGKRSLEDPRNRLVFDFVRLVSELRPNYFVFENVKGLTVGSHRQFLDELIAEFGRCGYRVRLPFMVLNAAEYGVPQNRQRLFLLGARKGIPLPEYPEPTHLPTNQCSGLLLPRTPTVWEAIGDLPEADDFDELLERDWVMTKFNEPSGYARVLRQQAPSSGKELLSSSLRTTHTPESIKRFKATKHGEVEPISRFFRLDPNGLSNTIRAGTGSERGAFTSPRPIHPFSPRCITVREAARLHSYPDWFRFHVTKWHGFRQVGNSVPPLLGKAVASEIGALLDCKRFDGFPLGETRDDRNGRLLQFDMSEASEWFGVSSRVIPARRRVVLEARQ